MRWIVAWAGACLIATGIIGYLVGPWVAIYALLAIAGIGCIADAIRK